MKFKFWKQELKAGILYSFNYAGKKYIKIVPWQIIKKEINLDERIRRVAYNTILNLGKKV